jgi:hypothetical protein
MDELLWQSWEMMQAMWLGLKRRDPTEAELQILSRLLKEGGYDYPTQIVSQAVMDEAEKLAK